jgi:hypothetical protein
MQCEEIRRYISSNAELQKALNLEDKNSFTCEMLAQGEHNMNFLIIANKGLLFEQKYVFRVNFSSQLNLDNQIEYEYNALSALYKSCRTALPIYVDNSCKLLDKGILVQEFLQGEWMDFEKPQDVTECAHILADIHSVCPPAHGILKPGDPLQDQFNECMGFFKAYEKSALTDDMVMKRTQQMIKQTKQKLSNSRFVEEDASHIINTEAVPSHFIILHDESGNIKQGKMVDWEKPIIAEVAQDIAYYLSPTTTIWDSEYIFKQKERDNFVEDYWKHVNSRFSTGNFEERFSAYVSSNCLRGITWSCNAWVEYHDPARQLKNEKTFNKLKIYLSKDYLEFCLDTCF